ncbi:MAG: alanine--tRNA ligase [Thermoguttaceae bacterium]
MKTNELREKYLTFFESKGCVRRPSDVLVPRWDPSVLFTPAGMNQFKDHFLGRCKLDFTRATTCQKCLRTGDIDNVGRTAYHHTFFEMLGNFSFGDYFKREAIHWAWEFLTSKKWLALDPASLSVTVYKDDDEAAKIWLDEIKIAASKLRRMEEDENFWPASAPSLGPDGVCGPCSEIYYHSAVGGVESTVEIWNLVFTQFNRVGEPPNNLRPLPSKNIDTGMGLERTAATLQGVTTNYHIDSLLPIVMAAADVLKQKYSINVDPNDDTGRRLRRITDHVRACTFAVHENVYPGNKEEKYVIRRLLRRAVLDGRQLGATEPFLHKLVGAVAEVMKQPYPELTTTTERVAQVIRGEEENFLNTIDSGLDKIEQVFASMAAKNKQQVSGADAFEMYQTYGFPPELFETLAAEQKLSFDWSGFKREMERHGEISGSAEKQQLFKSDPLADVKKNNPPTQFIGYDQFETAAKVLAIVVDGVCVDTIEANSDSPCDATILLDRTVFYGEKGGQVGDSGFLFTRESRQSEDSEDGLPKMIFEVNAAQCDGDYTVHCGTLRFGELRVGDQVGAMIDILTRVPTERAHSATHLLHHVLRKTLGGHAEQQGSKVDNDTLRFDFTHHQAVPRETLAEIEREVNELILTGDEISCDEMSLAEAKETGAMMLFGEKYPDSVRVVSMGESVELCGGTHLINTAQVGLFKIISESSVSSGTRRIEAVTGRKAVEWAQNADAVLSQLTSSLRVPMGEVFARVTSMQEQIKKAKSASAASGKVDKSWIDSLVANAETIGCVRFMTATIDGGNVQELRTAIDTLRQRENDAAILLAVNQGDDKVMLLAGVSQSLVKKSLSAAELVNAAATILGGKGGGRPDFAQAGGKSVAKIPAAIDSAREFLKRLG